MKMKIVTIRSRMPTTTTQRESKLTIENVTTANLNYNCPKVAMH